MQYISDEALDLFQSNVQQIARISVSPVTGEAIEITESDILMGGFQLNCSSISGSTIELGSVIASELLLNLDNYNGKFDDVQFEGAQLYVSVGVERSDSDIENPTYHIIPFGYFTVDEVTKSQTSISIAALDRMVWFDKEIPVGFYFNVTVSDMVINICSDCGIMLASSLTELPNSDYEISNSLQTENLTYRQLLSWCCQLMGVCAFINSDGKLSLKWYTSTDAIITTSNRYNSSLDENPIIITGVLFNADEQTFLSGTDEYAIDLTGNMLIQDNAQSAIENIYNAIGGFSYTPFNAEVMSMPHLEPLDMITYVDKNDSEHQTIISDWTFTLNRNTVIAGQGTSTVRKSYASSNPFTAAQSVIIERNRKEQENALNKSEQTLLRFNETIANSLGLYRTEEKMIDGSTKIYYHNAETLSNSLYAFTMTSNGFAFANRNEIRPNDNWPGDFWQYGIESTGNAILNFLQANKISADLIEAGVLKSIKTYDGENVMEFDLDNGTIKSVGEQEVITGVDSDGEAVYELVKGSAVFSNGGIRFRSGNIALQLSANSIVMIEYIKLPFGSAELPLPRWAISKEVSMFPSLRLGSLFLVSEFSSSDVQLVEATNATGWIEDVCAIRSTGSKVQLKGTVSFTTRSSSSANNIVLANITKAELRPKKYIYKIVPLSGQRVARMGISPNSGEIFVDWVIQLTGASAGQELFNENISWLQLDCEWDI